MSPRGQCLVGEMFDGAGEITNDPRQARALLVFVDDVAIMTECTGAEIWSERLH